MSTPASPNNQSDRKLKIIDGEVFQQSVAVAQLAVKLCEFKSGSDPKDFLSAAWDLIEGARSTCLRAQTDLEYLMEHDGKDGLAEIFKRRWETVPFGKLCDPERNAGDSEMLAGVEWKVYRTQKRFDDLFWKYHLDIGEKWKRGNKKIGTVQKRGEGGEPEKIDFYEEPEREELAKIASDTDAWKSRGALVLKAWKEHGVPVADFRALAKFRRFHDKRAANLKKPKRKRTRTSRQRPRTSRARGRDK